MWTYIRTNIARAVFYIVQKAKLKLWVSKKVSLAQHTDSANWPNYISWSERLNPSKRHVWIFISGGWMDRDTGQSLISLRRCKFAQHPGTLVVENEQSGESFFIPDLDGEERWMWKRTVLGTWIIVGRLIAVMNVCDVLLL